MCLPENINISLMTFPVYIALLFIFLIVMLGCCLECEVLPKNSKSTYQ